MNREERRKLEKKGTLEYGDLKRISDEISLQCTNDAFKLFILMSVFALRDEYGFADKRIGRYIDCMNNKIALYNEGRFNITDVEKAMLQELGFEVGKVDNLQRSVKAE